MSRKVNNISLAMGPEFQERLKRVAKKRGVSISELVRDAMEKFLGPDEDKDVDTIILKIPVELKKDPGELEKWVQTRMLGIVKALTAC